MRLRFGTHLVSNYHRDEVISMREGAEDESGRGLFPLPTCPYGDQVTALGINEKSFFFRVEAKAGTQLNPSINYKQSNL